MSPNRRPTREEAIEAAGRALAYGEAAAAQMTPREQAEAAWESDEIATVDGLETQIRALRAQSARNAGRSSRPRPLPTFEECVDRAGRILAVANATAATRTPREQAEAAWHVGSPFTVDELEDRIRVRRGLDPIHGGAA